MNDPAASGRSISQPTRPQKRLNKIGGLVMPEILDFVYEDGSTETERIPAEIWKRGESNITKVFRTDKEVKEIILDPYL